MTPEEMQKEIEKLTKKLEGRNEIINNYRLENDKLYQFIQKQQREIIDLSYDADKYQD